ncbi:MAG: phosphatase PAP2 family protein [Gemmatimonadales bacterium]|nr:phosphatase PAP2 family protein [Gemmatimonadales bacterium]
MTERDDDGCQPVDRWMRAVNLAFLAAWVPLLPTAPEALPLVVAHVAALWLPALRARAGRLRPPVAFLCDVYPLLWLAAFWAELGLRHAHVNTALNDATAAHWDLLLFGRHWNLAWAPAMPMGWLSEGMHAAYASYYLLLVGVPLAVLATRDVRAIRGLALRLAVTYGLCFIVYAWFPVEGPLASHARTGLTDGWWLRLTLSAHAAGNSLGTAFPSSHTAGAIALAWIACMHAPAGLVRRFAGPATVALAVAIALATVYTQNHYAVDTLAGIVVAVAANLVVVPALAGERVLAVGGRWTAPLEVEATVA